MVPDFRGNQKNKGQCHAFFSTLYSIFSSKKLIFYYFFLNLRLKIHILITFHEKIIQIADFKKKFFSKVKNTHVLQINRWLPKSV